MVASEAKRSNEQREFDMMFLERSKRFWKRKKKEKKEKKKKKKKKKKK